MNRFISSKSSVFCDKTPDIQILSRHLSPLLELKKCAGLQVWHRLNNCAICLWIKVFVLCWKVQLFIIENLKPHFKDKFTIIYLCRRRFWYKYVARNFPNRNRNAWCLRTTNTWSKFHFSYTCAIDIKLEGEILH